jgi:phosphoglycerate dehydrogenase-like enzyme
MSSRQENPKVLVIHDRPDDFSDVFRSRFPHLPFAYAAAPGEVESALRESDPRVVFSIKHPGFPAASHRPILAHPSVQWIQVGGSGYEHFLGWDAQRITLTNCAGVLSRFLAETVTGSMLMLNGKFLTYNAQQRKGLWQPQAFRPLCEQTLLIVGVGVIGGYIADNAKALGMRVLGTRRSSAPHRSVDEMYPPTALPSLLGEADVVSLHVRVTEETTHLIDREALAAMKREAILINTSRGTVVDEVALIEALQSGHLRAVYLDVFETEPLPPDSPLWHIENVFITPHAADFVPDWPRRFAEFFADNLERWMAGKPLQNVVAAASA